MSIFIIVLSCIFLWSFIGIISLYMLTKDFVIFVGILLGLVISGIILWRLSIKLYKKLKRKTTSNFIELDKNKYEEELDQDEIDELNE